MRDHLPGEQCQLRGRKYINPTSFLYPNARRDCARCCGLDESSRRPRGGPAFVATGYYVRVLRKLANVDAGRERLPDQSLSFIGALCCGDLRERFAGEQGMWNALWASSFRSLCT